MKSQSQNKKKTSSSASRQNKRLKSELQSLKKEKKKLKIKNKKLKQHKEELEEKIDSLKEENRKLLHQIEEGKEGTEIDGGSLRHNVENIRNLIKSARDQRLDISEEKTYLKEGISLFKKGEYAEAEDRFTECQRMLEKNLDIEDHGNEVDVEEQNTNEGEKEEVIENLQKIQGIGPSLAEEIYAEGFYSIEELKEASESELLEINGIGKSFSKTIKDDLD